MVLDTMVFVYSLLRVSPFHETATGAIEKAEEIWVPDSFHAEFANVVWQWIRSKNVPADRGADLLADVRPLITGVVPTPALWHEALRLSIERDHPVYDTVFVALARAQATKLVTYDQRLLERFPEHTVSGEAFVAG